MDGWKILFEARSLLQSKLNVLRICIIKSVSHYYDLNNMHFIRNSNNSS